MIVSLWPVVLGLNVSCPGPLVALRNDNDYVNYSSWCKITEYTLIERSCYIGGNQSDVWEKVILHNYVLPNVVTKTHYI